jgi:hypothetical protein
VVPSVALNAVARRKASHPLLGMELRSSRPWLSHYIVWAAAENIFFFYYFKKVCNFLEFFDALQDVCGLFPPSLESLQCKNMLIIFFTSS